MHARLLHRRSSVKAKASSDGYMELRWPPRWVRLGEMGRVALVYYLERELLNTKISFVAPTAILFFFPSLFPFSLPFTLITASHSIMLYHGTMVSMKYYEIMEL